jgi:hypothetical protein
MSCNLKQVIVIGINSFFSGNFAALCIDHDHVHVYKINIYTSIITFIERKISFKL